MKSITISNDQYQELTNRLDEITNQLSLKGPDFEQFVDNEKFVQLMKISKRTAQNWRDEGKIAFSQVGSKIYYKISDIDELLKHHYNRAFSPDFKVKLTKNI
jgi:predicted site-specific integrase-resolvase